MSENILRDFASGGDKTWNICFSRSNGFPFSSISDRDSRSLTWEIVWNFGDSHENLLYENLIYSYRDSRQNLFENLAVVITLDPISSARGCFYSLSGSEIPQNMFTYHERINFNFKRKILHLGWVGRTANPTSSSGHFLSFFSVPIYFKVTSFLARPFDICKLFKGQSRLCALFVLFPW